MNYHAVFIAGEDEYKSEVTLPALAKEVAAELGVRTTVVAAPGSEKPLRYPGTRSPGRSRSRSLLHPFPHAPTRSGRAH